MKGVLVYDQKCNDVQSMLQLGVHVKLRPGTVGQQVQARDNMLFDVAHLAFMSNTSSVCTHAGIA